MKKQQLNYQEEKIGRAARIKVTNLGGCAGIIKSFNSLTRNFTHFSSNFSTSP